MSIDGVPLTPFTHAVTEHDLMRYEAVRMSPVLFQERLDKKLELRVTVVANKVFAAEIYSANDPKQSSTRSH